MVLLTVHKDSEFHVGDRVRVHLKVQEDNKTRTQVFEGTVIVIRGMGRNKTFTVRRIGAMGVGIERIFPLFSPFVERVEVKAHGRVRRSKLYYIRDKTVREIADLTKRKVQRVAQNMKHKRPVGTRSKKSSARAKTSRKLKSAK